MSNSVLYNYENIMLNPVTREKLDRYMVLIQGVQSAVSHTLSLYSQLFCKHKVYMLTYHL